MEGPFLSMHPFTIECKNFEPIDLACVYMMQNCKQHHSSTCVQTNSTAFWHPFIPSCYFQDWRHDLWIKRLFRDHVRYNNEIQCAAARVIQQVRQRARAFNPDSQGLYDSMHIRLGKDFMNQFQVSPVTAHDIHSQIHLKVKKNSTLFIATDATKDLTFFEPLKVHYHLLFLADCLDVLQGINSNYFPMIEQLVASRGVSFFGSVKSTFTAYINRLRGYHANQKRLPGYQEGSIASWSYTHEYDLEYMHSSKYYPIKQTLWAREVPAGWRLIDTGIEEQSRASAHSNAQEESQ